MKRVTLLFVFAVIAITIYAQPYGASYHVHQGHITSSGHECLNNVANPGFVIGSYVPNGIPNFSIDRTNAGGTTTGAPWEFDNSYAITGDAFCGTTGAVDCAGITVIEENLAGGVNYAVTGSFSGGVFFSMLNAVGAPVAGSGIFLNFPAGTTGWTKPKMVASPFNANEYFIAGSYFIPGAPWYMYLLRVNNAGGLLGNQIFQDPAGNIGHEVTDIVASPYANYSPNEVVVVGRASDISGTLGFNGQGFFATFDGAAMVNTSATYWGQPWGTYRFDFFNCIVVSNNANFGPSGYAIGGYSDMNLNVGNLWTCLVDPAGATMYTSVIQAPTNPAAKVVAGIQERFTTYGQYSYFIVATATGINDMMALKLDWNMAPYPGWVYSANPIEWVSEFHYVSPTGSGMLGEAITYDQSGNPTDQGIHVYGTDGPGTLGNVYFVEAAFNGDEGGGAATCGWYAVHNSFAGPNSSVAYLLNTPGGLPSCTNFTLNYYANNTYIWNCGSGFVFPVNGSNNKPTAINKSLPDARVFGVYPNPTSDKINLSYYVQDNGKVSIEIYNNLGQLVKDLSASAPQTPGQQNLSVDLNLLSITPGIYFIKANVNGTEYKEKVVYNKQ